MGKIDQEVLVDSECRRIEGSVASILSAGRGLKEVLDSRSHLADFLCEVLGRPETAALVAKMMSERRGSARDAAIAECQEYLRKHVIEEVMET